MSSNGCCPKKYGSIIQVGQWQRSSIHFQEAMAFVHSGKLGPIRTVKVCCYQGWMRPQPKVADSEPPKGVNYDAWLGPAPKNVLTLVDFISILDGFGIMLED